MKLSDERKTHVEIISDSPADPLGLAIDYRGGLSTHLDGLVNRTVNSPPTRIFVG